QCCPSCAAHRSGELGGAVVFDGSVRLVRCVDRRTADDHGQLAARWRRPRLMISATGLIPSRCVFPPGHGAWLVAEDEASRPLLRGLRICQQTAPATGQPASRIVPSESRTTPADQAVACAVVVEAWPFVDPR